MENNEMMMELNTGVKENYDNVETEDTTPIDEAECESTEVKNDDDMLGTVLTVLGLGVLATALTALALTKEDRKAKKEERERKRYEKRKQKVQKDAAKFGEEVTVTKRIEESTEEVESDEVDSEENNEI